LPTAVGDQGLNPTVGVLALQGAFARHCQALQRCGVGTVEVRQPGQLSDIDALIIPGGESTTMSKLVVNFELVEPLAKLLADGLAVFGTCAGMILLATEVTDGRPDQHCFGAIDIGVRRNGYGRQIDSFEADIDLSGLAAAGGHPPVGTPPVGAAAVGDPRSAPGPLTAVFIRAPVVERVGSGVEVLAEVDGIPVLCREGQVLVSSFHPELTSDDRLHQLFLSSL